MGESYYSQCKHFSFIFMVINVLLNVTLSQRKSDKEYDYSYTKYVNDYSP